MRTFQSLALLAALTTPCAAQTLINGNFDTDALGWTAVSPGGGWQASTGSDGNAGFFWMNSSGGADLPSIEQSITDLSNGGQYEVSGFYRTLAIFNFGDPFRVVLDGNLVFSENQSHPAWTPFTFQFTATGANALLRFEAEVTADSDWAIDTISVKPVPTPGALGLIVTSGLVVIRRRR